MYSTAHGAFAPGQHIVPVWPNGYADALQSACGKGEYYQGAYDPWQSCLSTSQCVWVPAYILYGLLDTMVPDVQNLAGDYALMAESAIDRRSLDGMASKGNKPFINIEQEQDVHQEGKGSSERKNLLKPQEQEFHHEMLRKLALHLVAQPDQPALKVQGDMVGDSKDIEDGTTHPDNRRHADHGEGTRLDTVVKAPSASSLDDLSDRGVDTHWPATPSSMGEEQCDQDIDIGCSQCVWVPMYVVYGLLENMGEKTGKGVQNRSASSRCCKEQDLHQQMLQKLALHLAAQPDALRQSPYADATQASSSRSLPFRRRIENCQLGKTRNEGKGTGASSNPMQSCPQEQEFHQQMLQKLALHLAAQPHPLCESDTKQHQAETWTSSLSELSERSQGPSVDAILANDSVEIGKDKACCDRLISELEPSFDTARAARAAKIMAWVLPAARADRKSVV